MSRIFAITLFIVPMALSSQLWAATFSVTTTADSGAGSLRQAITDANASAGADEIVFDGVSGMISLTSALPSVIQSLTINGPGAEILTIDGGQHESIFILDSATNNQIYEVSGLTLTNGRGSDGAGAVYSAAGETTTISRCVITGNFGDGKGHGGAIASENGLLTIIDSTVTDNETVASGGGIEIYGVTSPKGLILNSTISGNRALNNEDGFGGGINCGDCELTIVNSTVSENEAAVSGGGISNFGSVTLLNVTMTGNTADADAVPNPFDGIDDGGGIYNDGGATVSLKNSILAGNSDSGGEAPDCAGGLSSQDFNLIGSTVGCTLSGTTTNTVTGEDALLASLADNGGPTLTHALLSGSPALNAGDPAGCVDENGDPLTVDQRGFERPVGSACDMGAFEAGGCGDGIQDAVTGEECDDGNEVDTDACKNDCTVPDDGGTGGGSTGGGTSGGNDSGGGCSLIR